MPSGRRRPQGGDALRAAMPSGRWRPQGGDARAPEELRRVPGNSRESSGELQGERQRAPESSRAV
eukprot:9140174-Alexandrium_andersonii.AAC.1